MPAVGGDFSDLILYRSSSLRLNEANVDLSLRKGKALPKQSLTFASEEVSPPRAKPRVAHRETFALDEGRC